MSKWQFDSQTVFESSHEINGIVDPNKNGTKKYKYFDKINMSD